jgi:DNA-binding LacI/PurR family transcriptional regulator
VFIAPRATIYAVADRAQISIATGSRLFQLSNKVAPGTRDRVLARIHGSASAAIPT